jgi:anaerobic magnesium-protoporphyrin IX monomethyl ester cyclase
MKRANCAMVFIGLESVNEETLKLFNKHSTLEKNRSAIAAFKEAGIRVHGMFVLGSDADTPETLRETLEFARSSRLTTTQFFALTALPGPPLTRRLAEEKRIFAWGDWQLFDAQHAVVCPSRISSFRASSRDLPYLPAVLLGQRSAPALGPRALVRFCHPPPGKFSYAAD